MLPMAPRPRSFEKWRDAHAGWIAFNIATGLAIWFLVAIVAGQIVEAVRSPCQRLSDPALLALFLMLPMGMAGWMLFVYLRTRIGVRWLILLASFGFCIVAAVVLQVLEPRLPAGLCFLLVD